MTNQEFHALLLSYAQPWIKPVLFGLCAAWWLIAKIIKEAGRGD